jgi:hypothetical protein
MILTKIRLQITNDIAERNPIIALNNTLKGFMQMQAKDSHSI